MGFTSIKLGNTTYNIDCLPLSGGTINSASWLPLEIVSGDDNAVAITANPKGGNGLQLGFTTTQGAFLYSYQNQKQIGIHPDGYAYFGTASNMNTLIHSGNIGEYNTGSATKLQTKRSLWGQEFDGTGNVNGSLYFGQGQAAMYAKVSGINDNLLFLQVNPDGHMLLGQYLAKNGKDVLYYGNNIRFCYGTAGSSSATAMLINSSGNVLIGTTEDKGVKLQVGGSIRLNDKLSIVNSTNSDIIVPIEMTTSGLIIQPRHEDVGYLNTMLNYSGGNVLIGTTEDKGYKLGVNGSFNATSGYINGNAIIHTGNIGSQSVNYANSAGSVAWDHVSGKPTIPSAVSESTVSGWGFTKNTGTVTSININGQSKSPSNGVVDLGTVITSHQDISGKQDKLVSGSNVKTINGQSVLGSGNIEINNNKIYADESLGNASLTNNYVIYFSIDDFFNDGVPHYIYDNLNSMESCTVFIYNFSTTPLTFAFPYGLMWENDNEPTLDTINTVYEISFFKLNGDLFATWASYTYPLV